MKKYLTFLLFLVYLNTQAVAQDKYWVYFTDKNTSEISTKKFIDIPISNNYLKSLDSLGIEPICRSKWLNAITAILDEDDKQQLQNLAFIKSVEAVNKNIKVNKLPETTIEDIQYGVALEQMDVAILADKQLNGQGITIGIIDAGFWQAHNNDDLESIFEDERVLGYKDFVKQDNKKDFFKRKQTHSDGHGTTVMRMIAGQKKGLIRYGLADKAKFYLARTDHGDKEFRGEEDYWIQALEWMDSLGVKLVNTSLGYALGFDNPKENYSPEDMDGKTTAITKAAEIAATEKEMLIIVSAGNEGDVLEWRVISAPADAKHVLSVGATNERGLKAGYSSIGPDSLAYMKPNVSCYSLFGTSFSAPVITGLAACLWQYKPEAKGADIFAAIEQSSQFYPYGNNYIGYGVPQASEAINILDEEKSSKQVEEIKAEGKTVTHIREGRGEKSTAIIFHKKGELKVIRQELGRVVKGKIKIQKPRKATRTTVYLNDKLYEIFWE